jgi:Cd2+/Zn2+-exporting ATPase
VDFIMPRSGKTPPQPPECLARSVVSALAQEKALEAVTIDREHRTISFATLGRADVNKVTERIHETFNAASDQPPTGCSLLAGDGDCGNCAQPLLDAERQKLSITHDAQHTTIARVTCPTAPKFWRWRDIPFPKVVPRELEILEYPEELEEWKSQLVAASLCGLFGLAGYLLKGEAAWSVGMFLLAYLAGSWFTVQEVWERLKKGAIDVHFLMLAVAVGSAAIGAWGEGAMLLFLFSLSGALEHFALGRTQREIRSLFHEAPKVATTIDEEGKEHDVAVEQLRAGMRLLVKPGAQFPVDGEVLRGQTAADESNLTGEAAAVDKAPGDTVLAGTINLWGAIEVVVQKPASESSLRKIIRLSSGSPAAESAGSAVHRQI